MQLRTRRKRETVHSTSPPSRESALCAPRQADTRKLKRKQPSSLLSKQTASYPPFRSSQSKDPINRPLPPEDQASDRTQPRLQALTTSLEKGGCPVDTHCPVKGEFSKTGIQSLDRSTPIPDTAHVISCQGGFYDATLTFTDAKKNSNKFFVLHVLRDDEQLKAPKYYTWIRWGRIGEKGRTALLEFESLPPAVAAFESKFEAKSGLTWVNRSDTAVRGKYTRTAPANTSQVSRASDANTSITSKCRLPDSLQQLLRFMLDENSMLATLSEFEYDSAKLPLGRLAMTTIAEGKRVLDELERSVLAKTRTRVIDLTNQYFTLIPHSFARNRPPLLDSVERIDRELALLGLIESEARGIRFCQQQPNKREFVGFKFNSRHVPSQFDTGLDPIELLYEGFDCTIVRQDMNLRRGLSTDNHVLKEPLDDANEESRALSSLLGDTQGPTHNQRLTLAQVFRFQRASLASTKGRVKGEKGLPRILFFATRAAQYGPILKHGLAAADGLESKEFKPFGRRGVYLTPVASKAAQNCYHQVTGNEGVLLVVESVVDDSAVEAMTKPNLNYERKHGIDFIQAVGRMRTEWQRSKELAAMVPRLRQLSEGEDSKSAFVYDEFVSFVPAALTLRYLLKVSFVDKRSSYY
ncbi:hypothetical protein OIV83_004444 [Microbotryomycetes sp. JL201]|nr:hypothetical protein OIV83_004444 [Microbotryomycetes sp. JL201]